MKHAWLGATLLSVGFGMVGHAQTLSVTNGLTVAERDSTATYLDSKYALGLLPIPEPSMVALAALAACALLGRRSGRA